MAQKNTFKKLPVTTYTSVDNLTSLYALEDTETGERIGFFASTEVSIFYPSAGRTVNAVRWAYALHPNEFRSGLNYQFFTRKGAADYLIRELDY